MIYLLTLFTQRFDRNLLFLVSSINFIARELRFFITLFKPSSDNSSAHFLFICAFFYEPKKKKKKKIQCFGILIKNFNDQNKK